MVRNRAHLSFVAHVVLALSSAACASKSSATGDETHFQMCRSDDDCKNLGDAYRCEAEYCRVPGGSDTGGAGSSESGGTGNSASGGASSNGGTASSGGARDGGASLGGALNAYCSTLHASSVVLDGGVIERLLGPAASTCTLRASDYDRSCTKNADCTLIGTGNACTGSCIVDTCANNTTINVSALGQYMADYDKTPFAMCHENYPCNCPLALAPRCIKGTCVGGLDVPDAGAGGKP
jgi:hypothetical protein